MLEQAEAELENLEKQAQKLRVIQNKNFYSARRPAQKLPAVKTNVGS